MRRFNYKLVLIFYFVLLLVISVLPVNTKGELNHVTILRLRGDYFFHIIAFLPFLPIIWLGNIHKPNGLSIVIYIIIGMLFASFTESIQYFLPYRAFNVNDLIANITGLLLGSMIFLFTRKKIAVS